MGLRLQIVRALRHEYPEIYKIMKENYYIACWQYMDRMKNKMETTVMGYIGFGHAAGGQGRDLRKDST